jgi:O-antigen ligase
MKQKIALWLCALTTLVVTPGLTFDPINVPKFLVLGIGIAILALVLRNQFNAVSFEAHKVLIILSGFLMALMTVSTLVTESNLNTKVFGSPGRQTGLISYLLLATALIFFSLLSNGDFIYSFNKLIIQLGFGLSIYGIFQYLGVEIFPYGNAYGSSVFGTFGNSNFLSAFLGMAAVAGFLTALNSNYMTGMRILGFLTLIFSILVIFLSNSQQGLLILVAGVGMGLLLIMNTKGKYLLALFGSLLYLGGALFACLAFFNQGPLASIVYQSSLGLRREYWYAALQVISNNMFFGVGLDNYGSHYRRSRSVEVINQNSEIVTDTAHNVFLDLGSGAGLFVLVTYLILILYVFLESYRVIFVKKSADFGYLVLLSVWIAYLVQSFISINNLGLAIWGWVIPGLLVGYGRSDKISKVSETTKGSKIDSTAISRRAYPKTANLIVVLSLFLGLSTIPTFVSSVYFYSSLKSGNPLTIKNSALIFPDDLGRYVYVVTALQSNGFGVDAREILRIGVEKFPDSFDLWRLYSNLTIATQGEVAKARLEMKRLDPNNPNLK